MKAKKMYFNTCHLAGRQYHDVDEVWEQLKVGTRLTLAREEGNPYDPNAVEVLFHGKNEWEEDDVFKLGYIPRDQNETIARFLEMGWNDVFECRISSIDPELHAENQITMSIRIKRCPTPLKTE